MATCHPDRLVRAKGLCGVCYYAARRRAKGIPERIARGRTPRTPDQRREQRLLADHGLTLAQFDALVAAQGGRCLICHRKPRHLHVDHDHETGLRRGLLCNPCNRGIGLLGDDAERLRSAAAYLELAAVRRARSA